MQLSARPDGIRPIKVHYQENNGVRHGVLKIVMK